MRQRNARGTTLIFVLGILALLSLFAISFASMTRLERAASANYMDSVRADFAARAGLNAGVSTLRSSFRAPTLPSTVAPAPPSPAGGFMGPNDPWFYRGHALNTSGNGNGIPLMVAMCSQDSTASKAALSLPLSVATTDPLYSATPSLSVTAGGNTKWISGTVGGTYFSKGDVFYLKILDCQGMLDANMNTTDLQAALVVLGSEVMLDLQTISTSMSGDTILSQPVATGYTVLDSLIPLKTRPYNSTPSTAYPSPFSNPTWLQAFTDFRAKLPGGQFRSKDQIHAAFQAVSSAAGTSAPGGEAPDRISQRGDDWYALFRDFLTCWSETDTNVVAGGATIALPANALATAVAARRPVNLNTAPRAVLTAVIANISASILDPTQLIEEEPVPAADVVTVIRDDGANTRKPIRPYKRTVPRITPSSSGGQQFITPLEAHQIAQFIVDYRADPTHGAFRSWHDVYLCFNAQTSTISNDKLAAVLGELCPCYMPLGWNPDRSMFYWDDAVDPDNATPPLKVCVDKSGGKTIAEGCFNSGVFEIESLGRVYAGISTPYVAGESSRRTVVQIGGTTWLRGQRDLANPSAGANANLVDAVGAPEPQNFASSNKLGGWVQAQPSTSGLNGAAWNPTLPIEVVSPATEGGKITADGFLQQRDYGTSFSDGAHADSYNDWFSNTFHLSENQANGSTTDQGHVEMWVKQPQDNTQGTLEGTNETFFIYVRGQPTADRHAEPGQFTSDGSGSGMSSSTIENSINGNVTDMGVGTRVEKYGDKFYVCRFFWGYPDGACPAVVGQPQVDGSTATGSNPTVPYGEMHRYLWSPHLSTWKPGTWHHVYVSWSDMTIQLYLDGHSVGNGVDDSAVGEGYAWQSPSVPGFFPPGHPDETDRIAADNAAMAADTTAMASDASGIAADNAAIAADNAAIAADNATIATDNTAISSDQTQLAATPPPANPTPIQNDLTAKQNDVTAKNSDITSKNADIASKNADIAAKTADKASKQADYDAKNADLTQANIEQGGNTGVWANDVQGLNLSAQAGLNKMKLRTYYPPLGGVDHMTYDLLGYHLAAYPGSVKPYTTLTSLGTAAAPFKLQNTMFDRWCNGTFDNIIVDQSSTSPPTAASTYRFGTIAGQVTLPITLPSGYAVRAWGFFPILAHPSTPGNACGVKNEANAALTGNDRFGDGRQLGAGGSGYGGPYKLTFAPTENMNVTPWALPGVWISYEVPTVVLEGGVEVDGT